MDLKKVLTPYGSMARSVIPNFFERVQNLSLVNTSWSKPQTTYEKNDCMDELWQQVAKFVFNVSNLLFSQAPTLYSRGGQTAAGEPHAALWTLRKMIYLFLFFISIAKCKNIVKWCNGGKRVVQYYFCESLQNELRFHRSVDCK